LAIFVDPADPKLGLTAAVQPCSRPLARRIRRSGVPLRGRTTVANRTCVHNAAFSLRDYVDVAFSLELLMPEEGQLSSDEGRTWSIVVPLKPFSANTQYSTGWRAGTDGPEVIQTSLVLESIVLPAGSTSDLVSRSFEFPINPSPGYIDGSLYLAARHNSVDVTRIDFGVLHHDRLEAVITGSIMFEFELEGVPNHAFRMAVPLLV